MLRRLLVLLLVPAGAAAQDIPARRLSAREVPAGLALRGTVEAGRRWRDENGENVLLLTRTRETHRNDFRGREIHAYHYVRSGPRYRLLWQSADFVRDCPVDVTLEFAPGSLRITDVDADGVAETSFVYALACHGGVDPATMKLILHEGATKYAVRGTTDLRDLAPGYPAPEMRLDPALARVPALRALAERQWRRFVRQRQWPKGGAP
ncbi:MAG TPA: hypothetical protein VF613_13845 [Longimicrobium sp.]|jgi:hypothetical protein